MVRDGSMPTLQETALTLYFSKISSETHAVIERSDTDDAIFEITNTFMKKLSQRESEIAMQGYFSQCNIQLRALFRF